MSDQGKTVDGVQNEAAESRTENTENSAFSPRVFDRYESQIGRRYGCSVVTAFSHTSGGHVFWQVVCDCGGTRVMATGKLRGIKYCNQCGAARQAKNVSHGETLGPRGRKLSKEYRTWILMRRRCEKPKDKRWHRYGGRGIKVCERWQKFENFLADMGRAPSSKHSIERRNNDGDYEPNNCIWATAKEQARNRRSVRIIRIGEISRPIYEWVEISGIARKVLEHRIRRNWPMERLLSPPRKFRVSVSA